jgi:hypothetical protein
VAIIPRNLWLNDGDGCRKRHGACVGDLVQPRKRDDCRLRTLLPPGSDGSTPLPLEIRRLREEHDSHLTGPLHDTHHALETGVAAGTRPWLKHFAQLGGKSADPYVTISMIGLVDLHTLSQVRRNDSPLRQSLKLLY